MFKTICSSRFVIVIGFLFIALVSGVVLTRGARASTATDANAASLSLIYSIKEFFGMQHPQTSTVATETAGAITAPAAEPMVFFGPFVTTILVDDFTGTAGSNLTSNGWTAATTGSGVTPPTISATGLTYTGYPSSGLGNKASLGTSGEDVSKTFTAISSGAIYTAAMINVTSSQTAGDYAIALNSATAASPVFAARVYIKKDTFTTNFALGISKSTGGIVYSPFSYSVGTTYLIVLKYVIVAGATNDTVALFVNPVLNGIEPVATLTATDLTAADPASITGVSLRQGTAGAAAALFVDGIRVGSSWPNATSSNVSVTYLGNGNTGGTVPTDTNNPYFYGGSVTALANTGNLVRTGFTFAGWNTAPNGLGTDYAAGSGTFSILANTFLFAKWIPITYTVTYDGNTNTGGSAPVDGSSPYNTGATVTVLGNTGGLFKTGLVFAGWNTQADGLGTDRPPASTFTINANTTLYAKWLPSYTVTYDGNVNTGGTAPVDANNPYIAGTWAGVAAPGDLVKTGFKFSGWNTAANHSGTRYTPAQAFVVNANTILYAQWVDPLCADAGLDPTFDTDGKLTTVVNGGDERANAVAVQTDGKIVVVGYTGSTDFDFAVIRYNTDGSLDTTFDTDGFVTTAFGTNTDQAKAVAIQTDGKIVVAGYSYNETSGQFEVALARYNTDGSLDTTFDGDGKVITVIGAASTSSVGSAIVIQPDGKIVVAGYSGSSPNFDYAVVRYNANGSLDTTFDSDGKVTTDMGGYDRAHAVALQADGKIIITGDNGSNADFGLARYNPNGSLDTTFDVDGKAFVSVSAGVDWAYSLAVEADGKIIAAGISDSGPNSDFGIVRLNTNGSLDTSFDGDGIVTTDFGFYARANSVVIQPDGRIVAGGYGEGDFALARYNADGLLDTTFDGDGKVSTAILSSTDVINAVALQPDGRIVAAGYSDNGTSGTENDFAVARYGVACTPEPTPTATATETFTPTPTSTATDTPTPTATETFTPTATNTATDTPTSTATDTPTPTATETFTPTATNTATDTPTPTATETFTPTATATETFTPTATATNTPTDTPTYTPTPSETPSISGTVTYGNPASPTTKFISNATVNGAGSPNTTAFTAIPGPTAGQYLLTGFGAGSYTVSLAKTTGQNGVSSADAARIAQHVAGTLLITSDRHKIAADVTNNGAISSTDAAQLARFVTALGPPIGLTNQWRFFVPGVSQPTFPIGASPTSRSYPGPIGVQTGQDYIGILVGEVTGNWNPTAARPTRTVDSVDSQENYRTAIPINVTVQEVLTAADKEIVVPVNVEDIADKGVISYEFDLRYDPSVMQPVGDGVDVKLTVSRGLSVVTNASEPGLLRVVVYGAYPIDENGVLLNLRFMPVGSVGSVSPISFERIMFNEGEPRVTVGEGQVWLF
ncbi:MAG: InlB B-repeat-containing protein [Chloracidobacterium sp.]|nr:InlB B-repeat-containing protein [Chloracidobacterium sp.]